MTVIADPAQEPVDSSIIQYLKFFYREISRVSFEAKFCERVIGKLPCDCAAKLFKLFLVKRSWRTAPDKDGV